MNYNMIKPVIYLSFNKNDYIIINNIMDNIKLYLNDIGFVFAPLILDELLYDKTSYLSYIPKEILNIIKQFSVNKIIANKYTQLYHKRKFRIPYEYLLIYVNGQYIFINNKNIAVDGGNHIKSQITIIGKKISSLLCVSDIEFWFQRNSRNSISYNNYIKLYNIEIYQLFKVEPMTPTHKKIQLEFEKDIYNLGKIFTKK